MKTLLQIVVVALFVILVALCATCMFAPDARSEPLDLKPTITKPRARVVVEVAKFSKGGYGTVAILDRIVLKNVGDAVAVDPVFTCYFYAKSYAALGTKSTTAYVIIQPGKSVTIRNLNLGFIDQQTHKAGCSAS